MMKVLAKMSQFVNKTFALWVVIFGIAGFVFPEIFKQIGPWIAPLLGVVMFGMGLTLSPSDFREIFRRPRDVFLGILAQFTIMPGGAFLLCYALDLPPDVAVGLMLLGCCPGGTASNVVTFLARGDVALSVTITSCTTLLAPVMTPALMYLFASQWLAIDPTAMFMSIVQIILLPIAAGVFVHKLLGARIDTAVAALPLVSVLAIVLIAAAVTAASRQQLMNTGLLVFVAVVLHNALGMLFGFLVAKWSGMNLAKCKCMAFEVGMQNSGLGVALASVHFAANPMTALPAAIAALRRGGCEVVLLTGDNQRTAEAIARQVGVDRVIAQVLPQDKARCIQELQKEGRLVAMVGDGVNDAPALVTADVGLAIGAGTDVAIESADVVLMRSSLMDIVDAAALSRAALRNIRQNLFWAFFYNAIGIPVAAGVLYPAFQITLNPMIAAAAMSLSSVCVVSNALRLRGWKGSRPDAPAPADKSAALTDAPNVITAAPAAQQEESAMKKTLTIEGMMCAHCAAHVEKALNALPGVTAQVDLAGKTAVVTGSAGDEALKQAVADAGYQVTDIR